MKHCSKQGWVPTWSTLGREGWDNPPSPIPAASEGGGRLEVLRLEEATTVSQTLSCAAPHINTEQMFPSRGPCVSPPVPRERFLVADKRTCSLYLQTLA